jgi:hypothetical protein
VAFLAEWDASLERVGAENISEAADDVFSRAITAKVDAATAAVEAARLTPEQRNARAIVDELEARGVMLGDTHFHADDEPEAEPDEDDEVEWVTDLSGSYPVISDDDEIEDEEYV